MWRVAIVLLAVFVAASVMCKTGRTYFTDEIISTACSNVQQFEWARNWRDNVMTRDIRQYNMIGEAYVGAEKFERYTDAELFDLMPPISIPRKYDKDTVSACPEHGTAIKKYSGFTPWKVDFVNHPYKLICPVGGEMYPTNDFAAGEMTGGEYPDDGSGCEIDGKNYTFIQYYCHQVYNAWVLPGIHSSAMAYLLTGEKAYAHRAAVLLGAVASQYPGPTYHSEHCYGQEHGQTGPYGRRSGLVTDYIWSCIKIVDLARAYDAIYPIYEQDPDLIGFLQEHGCIQSGAANAVAGARQFVEEHIFRQAMQALIDEAISGNPGHHQLAALTIGLIMDDHSDTSPNTYDVVRRAYYEGYAPTAWIFSNFLTRDGGGYEGPGYDRIKFNYIQIGQLMERLRGRHPEVYSETEFPDILSQLKARKMYDFYIDILSLGFFTPPVGDAGGARLKPGIIPRRRLAAYPDFYADGFRLYEDPRYARALLGQDGEMPQTDPFKPPIEQKAREAARQPDAAIVPETRLLDHYGFAFLNSGDPGRYEREAVINYTALRGHQQYDFLSLYLFAHEMSHLPDLGYPYSWDYRWEWDSNIYGHNTVGVDETTPLYPHKVPRGWVSLIGDSDGVKVAAVAHQPYRHHPDLEPDQPEVDRYERICVMVDEDEQDSYLLDLFVVRGGQRHDQSWHSVLRAPELPDIGWVEQDGGTAAGPDVAYDTEYTNVRGQQTKNAMCYVTDVRRAELSDHVMVDWDYELDQPAGMRLHLVPVDGPAELVYGGGRSPARPENWRLPYLFVRSDGEEGLRTRFLSILEPYRAAGEARIKNVTATGGWPLHITVERADVVDEITIHAPCPEELLRGRPRDIGLRVVTRSQDARTRDVTWGTLAPGSDQNIYRGQIVNMNRKVRTITVSPALSHDVTRQSWVRIYSQGRSSMYTIEDIQQTGDASVLQLKEPSLLGAGIPVAYQPGRIDNDVCLPFATGRVDEEGNLYDFACRHAGARVENADGSVSLQLRGINGSGWINGEKDYDLYLREKLSPQKLDEMFGPAGGDSRFYLHDYGIGDSVEIILSKEVS
ncbi:MAG: hypothetical protein R6V19_18000 [Armatimonadota bacterium]